jgi:hypothetical protein
LQALEEIFPGFQDDLVDAGAVPVKVAQDVRLEHPDHRMLSTCLGQVAKGDHELQVRGKRSSWQGRMLCRSEAALWHLVDFSAMVSRRVSLTAANLTMSVLRALYPAATGSPSGRNGITPLRLWDECGFDRKFVI